MGKQFLRRFSCAILALSLSAVILACPTFAEDRNNIVTFSPGMEGASISDDYVNALLAQGYEAKKSAATGAVSVRFPVDGTAPSAPGVGQLQYDSSLYYVVDPAADVAGSDASYQLSKEYVTEYARLSSGALDYVVEYRDKDTNAEIAPAERGKANLGATLTRSPIGVENYKAESTASAKLTITAAGPNLLTFYYLAVPIVETTTVTNDGGTIVNYQDVTVYAPAAAAPAGGTGGRGTGGGEVINPDETPLTGGENAAETITPAPEKPTEEITPNETPETNSPKAEKSGFSPMIGVGLGLLALLLALFIFLRYKKKNSQEE